MFTLVKIEYFVSYSTAQNHQTPTLFLWIGKIIRDKIEMTKNLWSKQKLKDYLCRRDFEWDACGIRVLEGFGSIERSETQSGIVTEAEEKVREWDQRRRRKVQQQQKTFLKPLETSPAKRTGTSSSPSAPIPSSGTRSGPTSETLSSPSSVPYHTLPPSPFSSPLAATPASPSTFTTPATPPSPMSTSPRSSSPTCSAATSATARSCAGASWTSLPCRSLPARSFCFAVLVAFFFYRFFFWMVQFEDESFIAVIDKGGLDALMEPELGPKLGKQYLSEVGFSLFCFAQ